MKSKVYFSRTITSEKVLELYQMLGKKLEGNVAIKIHSGEIGNQNFLKPKFWKPVIDYVKGTVVECNTAYDGKRNTTNEHLETFKNHGWDIFKLDLLDASGPDKVLDIPDGKVIKKNYVGKRLFGDGRVGRVGRQNRHDEKGTRCRAYHSSWPRQMPS